MVLAMTTIRTNAAALGAVQSLKIASEALGAAAARTATGLKVADAKDSGSTFLIAQKMRAQVLGLNAAADSLRRGQSVADIASAGAASISDLLNSLRQRATALADLSLDSTSRAIIQADIRNLIGQIDHTAKGVSFDGKRPLADTLIPAVLPVVQDSFTVPPAPLTPPSLAQPIQNTTGGASQTFVRDGGAVAGRVDLFLDALSVPDVLEIWQNGVRVAATGQPYAPGGGAVGPGAAVSGKQVLSFDYDPLAGTDLEFRFNENVGAAGSIWHVAGVVLQDPSEPVPAVTTTAGSIPVEVSQATTYQFISSAEGDLEPLAARALTANALGLDQIGLDDPGPLLAAVEAAIATANDAAAYFGERSRAFEAYADRTLKLQDAQTVGIGHLVDADMGREAAALQADKVRQQLAAQQLRLAGSAQNWLLSLLKR